MTISTDEIICEQDQELVALKARVLELEGLLNQNNIDLVRAYKLTPPLADVLGLLLAVPLVTPEAMAKVYADPRQGVYRLRKVFPYPIEGIRHVGWWISDTTKEQIKAAVPSANVVITPEGKDAR